MHNSSPQTSSLWIKFSPVLCWGKLLMQLGQVTQEKNPQAYLQSTQLGNMSNYIFVLTVPSLWFIHPLAIKCI